MERRSKEGSGDTTSDPGAGRGRRSPQRFAVDADFVENVFEELRRAFLDHVLDPQTGLQVLQEPLEEPNKVLRCTDTARDGLWGRGGAIEREGERGRSRLTRPGICGE